MKTEAEQKLESLFKDLMENTDYKEDWGLGSIEEPEFEFLKEEAAFERRTIKRKPRLLRVAGFILAVFVVSSAMTIMINSEFASANMFRFNNFVFNVKTGFLTSEIKLNPSADGAELLITNEKQISIGNDYLKELRIPEFIPSGYIFHSLRITNNPANIYAVDYTYINEADDIITILQTRNTSADLGFDVFGIEKDFYIGDAHIFYTPDIVSDYNAIYALTDVERISIIGKLTLTELTSIFENLY